MLPQCETLTYNNKNILFHYNNMISSQGEEDKGFYLEEEDYLGLQTVERIEAGLSPKKLHPVESEEV